jgi:hypothetical protein
LEVLVHEQEVDENLSEDKKADVHAEDKSVADRLKDTELP